MINSKKILFFIFTFLLINSLSAQSISFSQFYATKSFFNPSFIAQDRCNSFILHSYQKYPAVQGGYINSSLAYQNYFPRFNSGFSTKLNFFRQPGSAFQAFDFSISYVYNLRLKRYNFLSFNLSANFDQNQIRANNAIFSSSINTYNGTITTQNINFPTENQISAGTGFLFYGKKYFVGANINNLAKLEITGQSSSTYKWNITAGMSFRTSRYKRNYIEPYFVQTSDAETLIGAVYSVNKKWVGGSVQIDMLNHTIYGFGIDLGIIFGKSSFSLSYAVFPQFFVSSGLEFSFIYKFKCKKSRRKAIICPAYQL